jgi:large subunit ribosomal protein L21
MRVRAQLGVFIRAYVGKHGENSWLNTAKTVDTRQSGRIFRPLSKRPFAPRPPARVQFVETGSKTNFPHHQSLRTTADTETNMYAVVKTGGKQYRVAKDDVLTVEKLDGDAGAKLELAEVLAMDDGSGLTVGTPTVDGARVAATVLEQKKADKVVIFKKKRRKNYRRTKGHRQQVTVIRITDILAKGKKAPAAKAAAPAADDDTTPAKKAPAKAKAKAKTKAKAKAKAKKAPAKGK